MSGGEKCLVANVLWRVNVRGDVWGQMSLGKCLWAMSGDKCQWTNVREQMSRSKCLEANVLGGSHLLC